MIRSIRNQVKSVAQLSVQTNTTCWKPPSTHWGPALTPTPGTADSHNCRVSKEWFCRGCVLYFTLGLLLICAFLTAVEVQNGFLCVGCQSEPTAWLLVWQQYSLQMVWGWQWDGRLQPKRGQICAVEDQGLCLSTDNWSWSILAFKWHSSLFTLFRIPIHWSLWSEL